MTILDLLQLNDPQKRAATATGNVVVSAGAGSGKTRTLVGRYLSSLEGGTALREIVAITFTEKAAREMRTRIRRAITDWLARDPPRRAFWEGAFADLDAARVGTIHSLCAQVLRAHPVEAARLDVMPGFEVLEEGRAAVLRARAIEEALAWAASDDAASHLFGTWKEFELRAAGSTLLGRRLDADAAFARLTDDPLQRWTLVLDNWLCERLDDPNWQDPLDVLSGLRADSSTDKMELARQVVLAHAKAADAAQQQGDVGTVLAELAALRGATALTGRKANWPGDGLVRAKECMRALRAHFDDRLGPLASPRRSASWALDERVADMIWSLYAIYRRALGVYAEARRAENALDFDDLEAGALALLNDQDVRAEWQTNVRTVLVDEFQDTNERQRQIVYALTGFGSTAIDSPAQAGALFVVGDGKQSIYRFRGADVTVFDRVQRDIARAGGQLVVLDLTFRAHESLVKTTNDLLAPILGDTRQAGRPYLVPFAPLRAHRSDPRPGIKPPFVEFLLGLGDLAAAGRPAAAGGLTDRLHELHDREGVAWRDVALLFRASTAFAVYEDALEQAGIPFVTVAGRGFYDRPEVRSVLNALIAVADPTDDLAIVGFLRSPFVGLTDATLYALRFPPPSVVPREDSAPCAVWPILNHDALPDIVPPDDLARAVRGRALLYELHDLAGRVPVAVLIKRLLDRTYYRPALHAVEGGARAQRNVDKLLADAHTSGIVTVSEFVEYVQTLRGAGARESEAPTEAGSAVQLMTVHKAKGLEFPVVVIADAAHAGHRGTARLWLDALLGVTLDLRDEGDRRPAAHLLATLRNAERDEAEDRRLLYVAATRAREKLLVSAHAKILKGGRLSMAGWLKRLGQVASLDEVSVAGMPVEMQELVLTQDVGCRLYGWREEQPPALRDVQPTMPAAQDVSQDLVAPLVVSPPFGTDPKLSAREIQPPRRVWRVVPRTVRPHAPAWVVGTLVHAALRRWRSADDGWDAFLRPLALEAGIVDEALIHNAVVEAARMLRRFQAHPLWAELDAAQRWHEVPYSVVGDGRLENGIIDLLYRVGREWRIAEFKTDRLPADADLRAHIRRAAYDDQVRRYVRALHLQLGVEAKAFYIFLNVGGQVAVVPAS